MYIHVASHVYRAGSVEGAAAAKRGVLRYYVRLALEKRAANNNAPPRCSVRR